MSFLRCYINASKKNRSACLEEEHKKRKVLYYIKGKAHGNYMVSKNNYIRHTYDRNKAAKFTYKEAKNITRFNSAIMMERAN